jgi:Arc/MetJ-type ribon-helix-helix transcriptional regulator
MHVKLGTPYENIMDLAIKSGYASSQTEVLRQALLKYKEYLTTEEQYKDKYVQKIKAIDSGKFVKVNSVDELWSD